MSKGGAATLIVTPQGESVLVDTGNPGPRDAARITEAATKVANLREINHLVVTHYHLDHFGGAAALSKLLPDSHCLRQLDIRRPARASQSGVQGVQDRQARADQPGRRDQADAAGRKRHGSRFAAWPRASKSRMLLVARPMQAGTAADNDCCKEAQRKPIDLSDNANSVVLLLEFGPFRFFDAGDLTWNIEEKLVCPKNHIGQVDVYQVTHHGLDQSNNNVLVKSLEPRVAIMNNGVTKGCQPQTFATLKETKSIEAIYQVHKNLRPDGDVNNAPDEFIANHEKDCKGNYIKLSVAPDGKSYTVSVPATKHERTYQVRGSN